MKKYYQYFGLALIMAFSFYYTEKIATLVLNKNPLMKTINEQAPNYNIESVNALIEGDYITPGINGLKVNAKESFYKMQSLDVFNSYYLVFDAIKPSLSLENHKDKIISKANPKLAKVSIIFEEKNELSSYLKSQNIPANLLTTLITYEKNSYFELLNNEQASNFKTLENTLNLNKENTHICVLNNYNHDVCLKAKNYLVKPALVLNSSNIASIRKKIENGSIILIKNSATLSDLMLILKEIKYKDLKIVPLSELISENQNLFPTS